MPKKSKGKKGKGKKGKGKGGKDKKDSKKKENVTALAAANSKMWENRLEKLENSRVEYRSHAKNLLLENDKLQDQMKRSERDTIDVITYLKKQDLTKDEKIDFLQEQLKEVRREFRQEKETLIDDYTKQIHGLEDQLALRTNEVQLMQSELKMVKEFRRKRAQMQKELDEVKESMFLANKDHKTQIGRVEHKFFEEKVHLQQEANQKIAELAERAHTEAIQRLDETTKSVYKENVRLNEALNYHLQESEDLFKTREQLIEEVGNLRHHKEMNDTLVQAKVKEAKKQRQQIHQLLEKVSGLESALTHVIEEFDDERTVLKKSTETELEASRTEIDKLRKIIEMKNRESCKVKKLARNILNQRTDMERFFLESLEEVRKEIDANRYQYRKDAAKAYQERMLAAFSGNGDYPKVRTFQKSLTSTNSVFTDFKEAETWGDIAGKVDITDLTWEQKERVLRYLFAKMNGLKIQTAGAPPVNNDQTLAVVNEKSSDYIEMPATDQDTPGGTFITQNTTIDPTQSQQDMNTKPVLPEIGSTPPPPELTAIVPATVAVSS